MHQELKKVIRRSKRKAPRAASPLGRQAQQLLEETETLPAVQRERLTRSCAAPWPPRRKSASNRAADPRQEAPHYPDPKGRQLPGPVLGANPASCRNPRWIFATRVPYCQTRPSAGKSTRWRAKWAHGASPNCCADEAICAPAYGPTLR